MIGSGKQSKIGRRKENENVATDISAGDQAICTLVVYSRGYIERRVEKHGKGGYHPLFDPQKEPHKFL
jgi:hypothetical protein